jgi:hypothetical protein
MCALSFGQINETSKYLINAKAGMSFPVQGNYLKDNCHSAPYFGIDVIKESHPIDLLIGFDYESLDLAGDKLKFFSPHVGVLQGFNFNRCTLASSLNVGYSWFNYTYGKNVISIPPTTIKEYNQKGFNASLDVKLFYAMTDKLKIGIGDSYLYIFESFGVTEPKPDNSRSIGLNRPYFSLLLKI